MIKIITKSEKETFKLGRKLARRLCGGEVLALIGELGSGKTVLIKGIAAGLGIKKHITSPTFVLMKVYKTNEHESKTNLHKSRIQWLCHVDAYRLKSGQDLIDIGLNDWLGRPDKVTVIEWADRVKDVLPKNKIVIKFKIGKKKNERVINIANHTNFIPNNTNRICSD